MAAKQSPLRGKLYIWAPQCIKGTHDNNVAKSQSDAALASFDTFLTRTKDNSSYMIQTRVYFIVYALHTRPILFLQCLMSA